MSISRYVNWKENDMSSSKEEGSGGSKGIFIALIPWVVFTVLVAHSSLKLGSLAALAAAVVIAVPGIRAGRPKLLELGAVVMFIGFVVVAFVADPSTAHWVARYARGIAALFLALIAFGSLLFVPFTEQYAREQVPEKYRSAKRPATDRCEHELRALVAAARWGAADPEVVAVLGAGDGSGWVQDWTEAGARPGRRPSASGALRRFCTLRRAMQRHWR